MDDTQNMRSELILIGRFMMALEILGRQDLIDLRIPDATTEELLCCILLRLETDAAKHPENELLNMTVTSLHGAMMTAYSLTKEEYMQWFEDNITDWGGRDS